MMSLAKTYEREISPGLTGAIENFPTQREVNHCGETFSVSSFAFYADCPKCRTRVKVRSFGAAPEIEDLFDSFFAWMGCGDNARVAADRIREIAADSDDT
jgi:hypothetical protein